MKRVLSSIRGLNTGFHNLMAMKILRKVNLARVLVPSALFGYILSVEIVKKVIKFLLKKD